MSYREKLRTFPDGASEVPNYETAAAPLLKPCEMPAEKVICFIENVQLS